MRTIDTSDNCSSDSCIEVPIGYCNALFGYRKDSSSTYTIRVIDSSTGPNLNYTWYWGDGDSSTNPKPTHDYDSFGKYLIRLKVQTGNCISIYSDSLGMDSLGNLLKKDGFTIVVGKFSSIDNLDAGEALIYPNPAYGHVNIKSSLGVIESVELFNLEGKKLPSSFIELHDKHWLMELHQLSGTYYIEIITDRGALRQKIIVE